MQPDQVNPAKIQPKPSPSVRLGTDQVRPCEPSEKPESDQVDRPHKNRAPLGRVCPYKGGQTKSQGGRTKAETKSNAALGTDQTKPSETRPSETQHRKGLQAMSAIDQKLTQIETLLSEVKSAVKSLVASGGNTSNRVQDRETSSGIFPGFNHRSMNHLCYAFMLLSCGQNTTAHSMIRSFLEASGHEWTKSKHDALRKSVDYLVHTRNLPAPWKQKGDRETKCRHDKKAG